jgi:DHA2 family multidrug resistance protein
MFCLLPPMRIALGDLRESEVADASGLFNLMRNLGGAIGIALIDTILYGRVETYADDFQARLLARDVTAAQAIGLDPQLLLSQPPGPPDAAAVAYVRPLVEKASLALCVNEAWALLAAVAVIGMILVLLTRTAAEHEEQPLVALESPHPVPQRLDQVGP